MDKNKIHFKTDEEIKKEAFERYLKENDKKDTKETKQREL